jgi:hypothetical protein
MTLDLPKPVAAYFVADAIDVADAGEAVERCFADDAVVRDEGHTYQGRAAIKKWKDDTAAKYRYTSEPLQCEREANKIVVTSRLTGNFPGSPVDLRFRFETADERITSLEIAP